MSSFSCLQSSCLLFLFGCGFAALRSLWLEKPSLRVSAALCVSALNPHRAKLKGFHGLRAV